MASEQLPSLSVVPAWSDAPQGPQAGPRHVLRREHFGALLYDRSSCQYVPYDPEATRFLLTREDGPREPAGQTEQGFLRVLQGEGVLDDDGRLAARVADDHSHPERISAPLTVYLGATAGCNLACQHCQAGAAPGPVGALEAELIRRLFAELFRLGCGQVHVSGGEPLLHPEFFPLMDEAFRWGLNVFMSTNGTLLSEERAEALAERPFRSITVSLDAPDSETHDLIRGRGAFARARAGLERLAELRPYGITTTLTASTVGRVREMVRLAEELGAEFLLVRPALPVGRAVEHPELLPSYEAFRRTVDELAALSESSRIKLFYPPKVPHQETSAFVLERFGCVAGNMVCSVGPSGTVNPCALLGPSFDSGNLSEHTLAELWAEGRTFRQLRALEGNPDCWSCKHYDYCGGGCRARALAGGRDLEAPDPWCAYEPLDGPS